MAKYLSTKTKRAETTSKGDSKNKQQVQTRQDFGGNALTLFLKYLIQIQNENDE